MYLKEPFQKVVMKRGLILYSIDAVVVTSFRKSERTKNMKLQVENSGNVSYNVFSSIVLLNYYESVVKL